jgi:hypothetical protein
VPVAPVLWGTVCIGVLHASGRFGWVDRYPRVARFRATLVDGGLATAAPAPAPPRPGEVREREPPPAPPVAVGRPLFLGLDGVFADIDEPAAARAGRAEEHFAKHCRVRLHEKGGKRHEMPPHHKLQALLDEYLRTAGIGGDRPLFRSAVRRTGTLAARAMHRVRRLAHGFPRRAAELGVKVKIGCYTFRATGITAYIDAGRTLENASSWRRAKARAPPLRPHRRRNHSR